MARTHHLFCTAARDHDDSAASDNDSAIPNFSKTRLVQHAQAALGNELFCERVQCLFDAAVSERNSARPGRRRPPGRLRISPHLLAYHVAAGKTDAGRRGHLYVSGDLERIHDAADLSERSTPLSALLRALCVPNPIVATRHGGRDRYAHGRLFVDDVTSDCHLLFRAALFPARRDADRDQRLGSGWHHQITRLGGTKERRFSTLDLEGPLFAIDHTKNETRRGSQLVHSGIEMKPRLAMKSAVELTTSVLSSSPLATNPQSV